MQSLKQMNQTLKDYSEGYTTKKWQGMRNFCKQLTNSSEAVLKVVAILIILVPKQCNIIHCACSTK